jgi:trehalose utilization protein
MPRGIRVTIWNEGVHERTNEVVRSIYPSGMGAPIAEYLRKQTGIGPVLVSQLHDKGQGLPDTVLNATDVMTWWGHTAHGEVTDENVDRVHRRVLDGMGLIVLHSGHHSKIFRKLMGTSCDLKWREIGERERIWIVDPGHPIADGLPDHFEIPHVEMYGEHFDIPQPDRLVFISWFQGGEVFRSGCCFHRGRGKIFYFRPGHETFPIYHNETVLKVIANAVRWAAPSGVTGVSRGNCPPLEDVRIED